MMKGRFLAAVLLSVHGLVWAIPEGPEYPSPEWAQREFENYAKVLEAPSEQLSNPTFLQRWQEQSIDNMLSFNARFMQDPSWVLVSSPLINGLVTGLTDPASLQQAFEQSLADLQADPTRALTVQLNTPLTPLCSTWGLQCTGDPFRYPGADGFYDDEADVEPVVFYDQDCARISGRVWKPKGAETGAQLPAVVIENGSVQAPETLYWWAAQMLVRAGYAVMTFDPRGQGRSDQQTPAGEQGSNLNSSVFWNGLVNAIDFFRSGAIQPYPHNETCAGTYPTEVTAYNPFISVIDPERLGIVGHSLGALGVSVVQGYGAEGADPWPGLIDAENPVKVAVAWDGLPGEGGAGGAAGPLAELLPEEIAGAFNDFISSAPPLVPRVPTMGQSSEYGLTPVPFLQVPDIERNIGGFMAFKAAGVPSFEFSIQGSSHYEWSLLPTFPTTSWCPEIVDGQCSGGWGLPMAQHYTLAWLDRWLKSCGESGYEDADARLLADADWQERYSFYFRSARDYPDREGNAQVCDDIRAGCEVTLPEVSCSTTPEPGGGGGGETSGEEEDEDDPLFKNGCVMGTSSLFDPLLPLLLLWSLGMLWRRAAARSVRN